MSTKSSPFGALVAQRDFAKLDRLFFRTLKQSLLLLIAACASVFGGLLLCSYYFPKLASRVLTPWAFGLLLLTAIMNQLVFSEAIYLRAHKAEPFLVSGIFASVVYGCTTYLLGRYVSVNAVAAGFFVVTLIFGPPLATYIFLKKRSEWHRHS